MNKCLNCHFRLLSGRIRIFFPWRFLRIEIGLLMQSLNFSMCCSISWYKNFDLILWEYDSRILHRNLKLRRQHLYSWLFSWKYALLLMHTVYVYLIWVNFRNLRTRLKSNFFVSFWYKIIFPIFSKRSDMDRPMKNFMGNKMIKSTNNKPKIEKVGVYKLISTW